MAATIWHRALFGACVLGAGFFLGCGDAGDTGEDPNAESDNADAPETTGIVGAWVGGGDYLIRHHEGEDGGGDESTIPADDDEFELPAMGDIGGCRTSSGFEFFPDQEIDTEHESPAWVTRFESDEEFFELNFEGQVSALETPLNTAWETNRTGYNAYVLEIHNAADDPLRLAPSVSVDAESEIHGSSDRAGSELNIDYRLFVGDEDDCDEVTFDYDLVELELTDSETESNQISDQKTPDPVEIDGERVKVMFYTSASVMARSQETGEDKDGPPTASLEAQLRLDVNP